MIKKLTVDKIKGYKMRMNLANVYYAKSIKSLYAKVMSFEHINLEDKLKSIAEYEAHYESLPIEEQNNIYFKLQKHLD